MGRGKLIVIEGTDCSGKQTQTGLLIKNLIEKDEKVIDFSFPMYDTPTGKIVGGPGLGKEYICKGWFNEGFINVDPKVVSLYYAADRLYNINKINEKLNEGYTVILDRYVHSNMAHQGSKISNKKQREEIYSYIEKLEFGLCNLPKPDGIIFLHMPVEIAKEIRKLRPEKLDEAESSEEHLKNSERAYLELAKIYNYKIIECSNNNEVRSISDISLDVLKKYEEIKVGK